MLKIRLTKNELKKQKDDLKRFQRYLPTLILKKQQFQLEIIKCHYIMEGLDQEIEAFKQALADWVGLFSERTHISNAIKAYKVHIREGNTAGVDIPIFDRVEFEENNYDLLRTPLWIDYGVASIKEYMILVARHKVLARQAELLREELRITTQRVNLFEKVKIPEARETIRKIRIFLGDMGTAAVVTGKIAKQKIARKDRAALSA